MEIWVLLIWAASLKPFEGGQYQTREQCRAGMMEQREHWENKYKGVKWRCKMETQP